MTIGYKCCANCWHVRGLRPDEFCEHIQAYMNEAAEDAREAARGSHADLLAALKGIKSVADYMNWPQDHEIWRLVSAAIAKAEQP